MGSLKHLYWFIEDIFKSRKLIIALAKKDFQSRYLGSFLGIVWAFIQPTITILIFWFVFQVGFKSMPVDNFPFILWLMCGMIPWFFFSESLAFATNSVIDNSHLVKKIVFRVSVLPIIKILTSLFIHVFFILFLIFMFWIYDYAPNIYYFQIVYYLLCTILLVLGVSWVTSSLVVFLKDVGQIVTMVLQFGFWLTPIFWSLKTVPEKYSFLVKVNPFYYIVEGYRDTLIYHKWFWQHAHLTLYFWFVVIIFLMLGAFMFRRLRPHFADML